MWIKWDQNTFSSHWSHGRLMRKRALCSPFFYPFPQNILSGRLVDNPVQSSCVTGTGWRGTDLRGSPLGWDTPMPYLNMSSLLTSVKINIWTSSLKTKRRDALRIRWWVVKPWEGALTKEACLLCKEAPCKGEMEKTIKMLFLLWAVLTGNQIPNVRRGSSAILTHEEGLSWATRMTEFILLCPIKWAKALAGQFIWQFISYYPGKKHL